MRRGCEHPLYSGSPASFGQSSSLSLIPSPSESESSSNIEIVIEELITITSS